VSVPVLHTERLILRGHRPEDFDALHLMWSDPAVFRHIVREPQSREQNWSRLVRYAGHWSMLGYGFWIVTERLTGQMIGELGFADFRRDIDPPLGDRIEMGWVFASAYHGKGFATESLNAVIAWGEENLNGRKTACMIDPANFASIKIAEKFGFRKVHETIYHGDPVGIYHRG
jgi:RimJ/RimL family protein N-acetyltransferase